MAETAVTQHTPAGPYTAESASAKLATLTFTAVDTVNGNVITMRTGRTLLIVHNSDGSPGTITVESSADRYGREADITAFSIAGNAFATRIFTPEGWEQTVGGRDLVITGSATTMKIAAIAL